MKTSSRPTTGSRTRPLLKRALACAVVAIACPGAPQGVPARESAGTVLRVESSPSSYRLRTTYRAEMRFTAHEVTMPGEPTFRVDNANPPGSERVYFGEVEYREDGERGEREYLACRRSTVTSRDPDLRPSATLDYPEDRVEHGAFEGCTVVWPDDPSRVPLLSCKSGAPRPGVDELRKLRRDRPGLLAAFDRGGPLDGQVDLEALEPGRTWDLSVESIREMILVSQPPWLVDSPDLPMALIDPFEALRSELEGGGTAKLVSIDVSEGGPAVARIELDLELRGSIPTPGGRERGDRTVSELVLKGTLSVNLDDSKSASLLLAGPLHADAVSTLEWQGKPVLMRWIFDSAVVIEQILTPEARISDQGK
jgi:hypothetical protein